VETWIRERMFDIVAAELGLDPVEFRRRNLWRDDELPRAMVTGPSLAGLSLRQSLDLLERDPMYDGFRARQREALVSGRYLGIGVSAFIEPAPGPPDYFPSVLGIAVASPEPARARIDPDGSVIVSIIQTPGGQGHETTYAQVAADELGVDLDAIRVVHGDTAVADTSVFGTAGSRSANACGGAVQGAARDVATKVREIAAHLLEASEHDIELAGGRAFVRGTPERGMTLGQVAQLAWFAPTMLPPGMEQGLECRHAYWNADCDWSQAVHCCVVEIDAETGRVTIERYAVFEDCGDIINPAIVDGQIRGGVTQGISTVLFERAVYDDDANFLTSTFLDYLVPSAAEIPSIDVHHVVGAHRTTVNYRGVGEGGAIASPAAVCNAIADALAPFGARVTELHNPPATVVEYVRSA
jgi:carbon-monoxide dehydrogenase large subunit